MMDFPRAIEQFRKDAAEAALIRDLSMDGAKREVFNRLCEHPIVLLMKSSER